MSGMVRLIAMMAGVRCVLLRSQVAPDEHLSVAAWAMVRREGANGMVCGSVSAARMG
jgi:hypothetical protein